MENSIYVAAGVRNMYRVDEEMMADQIIGMAKAFMERCIGHQEGLQGLDQELILWPKAVPNIK